MGVSITYFWGWKNLPIPRPDKLVYVRGRLLGMPKIEEPTQEDIDFWHKKVRSCLVHKCSSSECVNSASVSGSSRSFRLRYRC